MARCRAESHGDKARAILLSSRGEVVQAAVASGGGPTPDPVLRLATSVHPAAHSNVRSAYSRVKGMARAKGNSEGRIDDMGWREMLYRFVYRLLQDIGVI